MRLSSELGANERSATHCTPEYAAVSNVYLLPAVQWELSLPCGHILRGNRIMSTEAQYFVVRDGLNKEGPLTFAQVREMAANGQLQGEHLVWAEGMATWVKANTLPDLIGGGAASEMNPAPPTAAGPIGGYATGGPVEYAGFWLRFVALFLDGLITAAIFYGILMVFILPAMIMGGVQQGGGSGQPGAAEVIAGLLSCVGQLVGVVAVWLYFAKQESGPKQATIGKRACGIIVTDLNGNRINFGQATGRYFAKVISGFILMIGYIMAAFTERKQALHDKMASTLVVMGKR